MPKRLAMASTGQVAEVAKRNDDLVVWRERGQPISRTSRRAFDRAGRPSARATSVEMSVVCQRDVRSQAVAADVDEDPIEPGLEPGWIAQRRPPAPGLDERVVRRVLRLDRVAEDGARQTIGGVKMLVGEAQEGGRALARRLGLDGPAVCQLDDLGRSAHDDMTNEPPTTFNQTRSWPGRTELRGLSESGSDASAPALDRPRAARARLSSTAALVRPRPGCPSR